MMTYMGRVTDETPPSLGYRDYRGYVEIDEDTGEWIRDVTDAERSHLEVGETIYSVEYADLRRVEVAS